MYVYIIIGKIQNVKLWKLFFTNLIFINKKGVVILDILDRIIMLLGDRKQKSLLDYLEVSNSTFSDWKSKKSESYIKHLIKIADFFDVSIDYLVYGENAVRLTEAEEKLITDFRNLSPQGQEYILQQMFMAKEVYKKQNISQASVDAG